MVFVEGQAPPNPVETPRALYCHIPFCVSRCHYCDFVTYAGLEARLPAYVAALCQEVVEVGERTPLGLVIDTVYLGGGTPSLLEPASLQQLGAAIQRAFRIRPEIEFTLEANPGDADAGRLQAARDIGVNRLSLGMQSADDRVLGFLGRRHRQADTVSSVRLARRLGFDSLNLDLIFGLPGQSLETWRGSVEAALALEPEHLSAYGLSIEAGTPLHHWIERGLVEQPNDDEAASQYEWLERRLDAAGFKHYEISNWARGDIGEDGIPRFASRHNVTYWGNRPYLGLGAGAHGYANGLRYTDVPMVGEYIQRLSQQAGSIAFPLSSAAESWTRVGPEEAAMDTMLLGLRLTERGVDMGEFRERHGEEAWQRVARPLARLCEDGLLEWLEAGRRIRLTGRGRLLANRVFREFV
jgi:oxygen-independent coproporphyrinogen-3 oxidase